MSGLIIARMVIDMNETRLRTIEQIEQFISASEKIKFVAHGDDGGRYEHISRVLKRFDYPQQNEHERGVLRVYLQRTTGYSRARVTRRVTRWQGNRLAAAPLNKRYRAPVVPFARKFTPATSNYSSRWTKPMRTPGHPQTGHNPENIASARVC
jgi:hypothetical protein